jgi:hypothetical protein
MVGTQQVYKKINDMQDLNKDKGLPLAASSILTNIKLLAT